MTGQQCKTLEKRRTQVKIDHLHTVYVLLDKIRFPQTQTEALYLDCKLNFRMYLQTESNIQES